MDTRRHGGLIVDELLRYRRLTSAEIRHFAGFLDDGPSEASPTRLTAAFCEFLGTFENVPLARRPRLIVRSIRLVYEEWERLEKKIVVRYDP